jgi:hypothetical protein
VAEPVESPPAPTGSPGVAAADHRDNLIRFVRDVLKGEMVLKRH